MAFGKPFWGLGRFVVDLVEAKEVRTGRGVWWGGEGREGERGLVQKHLGFEKPCFQRVQTGGGRKVSGWLGFHGKEEGKRRGTLGMLFRFLGHTNFHHNVWCHGSAWPCHCGRRGSEVVEKERKREVNRLEARLGANRATTKGGNNQRGEAGPFQASDVLRGCQSQLLVRASASSTLRFCCFLNEANTVTPFPLLFWQCPVVFQTQTFHKSEKNQISQDS